MTWRKAKPFSVSAEAQVQPAAKYKRVGHGDLIEHAQTGKQAFQSRTSSTF